MEVPPAIPQSDPLPTLAILHFVLGGFSLLGLFGGLFYAFFARTFVGAVTESAVANGGTINGRDVGEMSPEELDAALAIFDTMGSVFVVGGLVIAVLSLAYAILLIMAGRNLRVPTGHTFCTVVAGASCLLFPFGTALGIFTLITLTKPEVRSRFR